MLCDQAKSLLLDYLDQTLSHQESEELMAHVHHCPSCSSELTLLKNSMQNIQVLSNIRAPEYFLHNVRSHIYQRQKRNMIMRIIIGLLLILSIIGIFQLVKNMALSEATPSLKAEQEIRIELKEFVKNNHISGRVLNISPNDIGHYKVVVYVLTDKWYIHPYTENEPGRGYAAIQADGSWTLPTVFRGYPARRLGILITPQDATPADTIAVSTEQPDNDLLSHVRHIQALCAEAPEGL